MSSKASMFYNSELELSFHLMDLDYGPSVTHLYNPLDYAKAPHVKYLELFLQSGPESPVMLLGMNPGPWGMGQTGVPFGDISTVRDWLHINETVNKPQQEHPYKLVTGFDCGRSEVSGSRLWSLLRTLSGDSLPHLKSSLFVHNYCPILMLGGIRGNNITPADLKAKERRPLENFCDKYLLEQVTLLGTKHLVAVGNYSAIRASIALKHLPLCKIYKISHPSPRNRLSAKNWIQKTVETFHSYELLKHFPNCQMTSTDEKAENMFMPEAFLQAEDALQHGEVPIGCVFVRDGKVIARGRNNVNETCNASRHAEINCIDQVIGDHGSKVSFSDVDVYVTVEPCMMCADALGQLNIRSVTYGAKNDRFGGCGSVFDVPKIYEYNYKITSGVRSAEAIQLLKDFYKEENPNAPTSKARKKNK